MVSWQTYHNKILLNQNCFPANKKTKILRGNSQFKIMCIRSLDGIYDISTHFVLTQSHICCIKSDIVIFTIANLSNPGENEQIVFLDSISALYFTYFTFTNISLVLQLPILNIFKSPPRQRLHCLHVALPWLPPMPPREAKSSRALSAVTSTTRTSTSK